VGSHPQGVDIEMRRHSVHGQLHLRRRVRAIQRARRDANYTNYYHRELEAPDIVGTEFGLLTAALPRHHRPPRRPRSVHQRRLGTRLGWRTLPPVVRRRRRRPTRSPRRVPARGTEDRPAALQGGGRFDWHRVEPGDTTRNFDIGDVRTRTFASVSGSLGLLVHFSPDVAAGLSAARAYRTPDTNELFSQGPHLAAYSYEVGNPDLDAETGFGLDAFVRVNHERMNGEVAVFRNALTTTSTIARRARSFATCPSTRRRGPTQSSRAPNCQSLPKCCAIS
jgi:iron complex outermembrane recepter protein